MSLSYANGNYVPIYNFHVLSNLILIFICKLHWNCVFSKATVKESENGAFVLRTIQRSRLWEIHTPQVATKALFLEGFDKVKREGLEVTDDVSVIEALGKPVKLTLG